MLRTGLEYYLLRRGPLTSISAQAALFARTRRGAGDARHQDVDLDLQRRSAAGRAAQVLRLHHDRLSVSPGKPRRDQAEIGQPGGPTGDASELPVDRDRSAHHRRRAEAGAPAAGDAATCSISSPANTFRAAQVQTDDELLAYARQHGSTVFHPTSTCKMGIDAMAVVGCGAARARARRAARGGRIDHADGGVGQHQRGDDHDRGEARGPGARGDAPRRHRTAAVQAACGRDARAPTAAPPARAGRGRTRPCRASLSTTASPAAARRRRRRGFRRPAR